MLLCERFCCIRTIPHKRINFGSSISLLLLDSQGWGIRECWCASESFAPERPDRWLTCGQELLELAAPLLFWFSSSVKEFPTTEVGVWASSSFSHYGWLEFQKRKNRPTHTSVYPGLPSVPLACWCHRVAPCSTYISSTFSSSAEVVKVVLSDTSLSLPGTYQNPRALGISPCCGLVNDFFWKKNIVFLQLTAYHYHLCSFGHYTL